MWSKNVGVVAPGPKMSWNMDTCQHSVLWCYDAVRVQLKNLNQKDFKKLKINYSYKLSAAHP